MILPRNVCSTWSLLTVLLLHIPLIFAQAGELAFFLDASCNRPSLALPTASLELSTCLVPAGAFGLVINAYPACPNGGTARMIMYKDSICAQSTKGFLQNKCSWFFATLPIPSVMFTCEDEGAEPRPTSTVTAAVSRIAGVATTNGAATSTTRTTTTPVTAAPPTPTLDGADTDSTGTTQSRTQSQSQTQSQTPVPSGSVTNSGSGSQDMSTSDKIAIGVGVGIGLPTLFFGIVGVLVALGWRPGCTCLGLRRAWRWIRRVGKEP